MSDERYIREALEAEDLACEYEAIEAIDYTRKWHVTWDWAFEVLEWDDPTDWPEKNPRVTRVRASIVRDLENEEEAFKRAIPVELIDDWLSIKPPNREATGRRRVIIKLYTWVIDRENQAAYDPDWLKIADDMSAYAATMRARRWAESYAEALQNQTASREIRMTQIEILWWTTGNNEGSV